jgi:hypothetical protein
MRVIRLVVLALVALCAASARPALSQQTFDFTGRVFDATSQRGIENLEVKLTPPKDSRLTIRVANTDQNGLFVFKQLTRSRYLLEVSQGVHILYRVEVDANTRDGIDIPLERKR